MNIFVGLVIPLIPLLLLFLIFYREDSNFWRRSLISSAIVWGGILTSITEFFSLFHLIGRTCFVWTWMSVSVVLIWRLRPSIRSLIDVHSIFRKVSKYYIIFRSKPFIAFSFLSLAINFSITGAVAILIAPNTIDSMTYHMSRVSNWIHNHSVIHYPTHNVRQLDLAPWAEFAILHFQVLSGGDYFANLVQWFSMLGCVVGISLIAQQLGASLAGQVLSSVICASIPMGILQSVTTQNDYVIAFWLVCLTSITLQILISRSIDLRTGLEFGASLGLALLTKGTGYIYAFPLCIVMVASIFKYARRRFWITVMSSFSPVILLNLGHWWRNIQVFQSPLGISGDSTKNHLFTLNAVLSNFIRGTVLHLPVFLQSVNHVLERLTLLIHIHILRLDINDPRTTFANITFQIPVNAQTYPIVLSEDISGNLLHVFLIFLSVIIFFRYQKFRNRKLFIYFFSLLGIIFIFNLLLAWQPWISRLQLPFFVLSSAFVGSIIIRFQSWFFINYLLVFILTVGAFPYFLYASPRPIMQSPHFVVRTPLIGTPRVDHYFPVQSKLKESYTSAISTAISQQCNDIGLYPSTRAIRDYPFWIIAQTHWPGESIGFRAVQVGNPSSKIVDKRFKSELPCAIFTVQRSDLEPQLDLLDPYTGQQVTYRRVQQYKHVHVYMK